jgi:hypothetical protein
MSTPLALDVPTDSAEEQTTPPITKGFWLSALILIAVAWSLQAYAIWSVTYLPLIDLPNHMARHYLEAVKLSGGAIGPYYDLEPRLIPNLGADLIMPLLILAFGAQIACKLFLTLSVFLYWFGPAWFIAQQGGYRIGALAAALLLLPLSFSAQFYWGFLNFYSGVGLAFLVLVHFTWLQANERPPVGQIVLHALLVALLFLWHLAPWMIYVVIALSHFLANSAVGYFRQGRRSVMIRRGLVVAVTLVPSFALFAYYSFHNRGINPESGFEWGSVTRKALLPLSIFRAYDWRADVIVCLLWTTILLVCFRKMCQSDLFLNHLALAFASLVGMYLVLPFRLGGTLDADSRILPAVLICGLACFGQFTVRHWRAGMLLLVLCLAVRFGSIFGEWQRLSADMEKQAKGFAAIEEHSRVLPVILADVTKDYPGRHLLAWIVLSKNVLVSNLFCKPDQQPLTIIYPTPPVVRRHADGAVIDERARDYYDYVWVYNPAREPVRVPESFACVFSGSDVSVWRIRSQQQASR